MKVHPFAPVAVQEEVTRILNGQGGRTLFSGLIISLAKVSEELSCLEEQIETEVHSEELRDLWIWKSRTEATRDYLQKRIGCLHRLVEDDRMRGAYSLLASEIKEGTQWAALVNGACSALDDFVAQRKQERRAAELRREIAIDALRLAKNIEACVGGGGEAPGELTSVHQLLRRTRSTEDASDTWLISCRYVLGEPHEKEPDKRNRKERLTFQAARRSAGDKAAPVLPPFNRSTMELAGQPQLLALLRSRWHAAPPLPFLLRTLAEAARMHEVEPDPAAAAVLPTRQASIKTICLRAVGHQLASSGVPLTSGVEKAIAIVANVVIDSPDIDVSLQDARYALKVLKHRTKSTASGNDPKSR